MKRTNNTALTIVEIMVVVVIIGILAAIAVPNYMEARDDARDSACDTNREIINAAIQQWALENSEPDTEDVSDNEGNWDDYLPNEAIPTCPDTGTYTYGIPDTLADYLVTCPNGH